MTPSTSLNATGIAGTSNFKKAKDRVTILACSNASGSHYLPLVLINKSAKPRCFKHMDINSLPVHYYSQKKSWMDRRIFSEWFHQRFVPSVRIFCCKHKFETKALLLLDNAPSHPSSGTLQSDDGKIKTMFLPPNTTVAIQPMDQAILDPCKRRYKRKLLAHIILENESADKPVPEILKAITMKDVVYWIALAWEEASPDGLRKAWNNLHVLPESESDEDVLEAVCSDLSSTDVIEAATPLGKDTQDDVAQWMEADTDDHQVLDDDEIVADMLAGESGDNEESSDEEVADDSSVNASEAFDALEVTLRWLEQRNADSAHLLLVKKWRDEAVRMRCQSMKQTSMLSYCTIQPQ